MTVTPTEYKTIELDLSEDEAKIFNIILNEGRLQEQERIIALINTLYDITCCCDSDSFGNHYLSHKQPDNLIDLIKKTYQR